MAQSPDRSENPFANPGGEESNNEEDRRPRDTGSADSTASMTGPQAGSKSAQRRGEIPRVRFTPASESVDRQKVRSNAITPEAELRPPQATKALPLPSKRSHDSEFWANHFSNVANTDFSQDLTEAPALSPKSKSEQWKGEGERETSESDDEDDEDSEMESDSAAVKGRKMYSQMSAEDRAHRLAASVGSPPASRTASRSSSIASGMSAAVSQPPSPIANPGQIPMNANDIPLETLHRLKREREAETDEDDAKYHLDGDEEPEKQGLVRRFTSRAGNAIFSNFRPTQTGLNSGQITPVEEQNDPFHEKPREGKSFRPAVLAALLSQGLEQSKKGHQGWKRMSTGELPITETGTVPRYARRSGSIPDGKNLTGESSAQLTPGSSGYATPRGKKPRHPKWYDKPQSQSTTSLSNLMSSSHLLPAVTGGGSGGDVTPKGPPYMHKRSKSATSLANVLRRVSSGQALHNDIHVHVHIAAYLSRQRYLIKLCRVLMQYGAPTHRLEGKHLPIYSNSHLKRGADVILQNTSE